jgi:hypothetical protein
MHVSAFGAVRREEGDVDARACQFVFFDDSFQDGILKIQFSKPNAPKYREKMIIIDDHTEVAIKS